MSPRPHATESDHIEIVGAREHNLDVPYLELPKRSLVVFTGVSGSGKSSLAFDTLYAEGQRRYVESLSAYARQFLGRLERPAVERLRGLSPTIAIEQKSASNNPRSTVGTITEIYDYLRVLYARAGVQHCHLCGKEVRGRSAEEVVRDVETSVAEGARLTVLAPLVTHRKGEFRELFVELAGRGFVRARVDGEVLRVEDVPALEKHKKHTLEVVVDRLVRRDEDRQRLTEAVEAGLREGQGELLVEVEASDGQDAATLRFSESRMCCGVAFPELSPQSFSFNSPLGMCPSCQGLGTCIEVDPDLVVPDPSLSIREGAIAPWKSAMDKGEGWTFRVIDGMAKAVGVNLDTPYAKLSAKKRAQVLYGLEGKKIRMEWGSQGGDSHGSWAVSFSGVIPRLERLYHETKSEMMRLQYAKYFGERHCDTCEGRRLRPESLAVRVGSRSVSDVTHMTVLDASTHFDELQLTGNQATIAEGALREIRSRLRFLLDVGLEYLTLDRPGPSLSGGEAQRIRLASQLGSELSGVMYVLDEPSIGLHQRDNERLIRTLERLRDLGNSVIVVEHDEETIRAADHLVDFGVGAGRLGGKVLYSGEPEGVLEVAESVTGQYLSGARTIPRPDARRAAQGELVIRGARMNNLHRIDVTIPLGVLTAVTGVSGAGKSSLVNGILLPALGRKLHNSSAPIGPHDSLDGLEAIDKVIAIDQRPIGRTPRSNPGTYTKAFDEVRVVFAQLPDARTRGFTAGRFSFNVKGGRCEACSGDGQVKVEMHFLSDVFVPCEVCEGKRYNSQTLAVRYRGKSITDVLAMSIDDCAELFSAHPKLAQILSTLQQVGLGYMQLGQPAPTMSGGEAQRVKLSRELAKRQTGRTLYVLDEPTTGLHFEDIRRLLGVLQQLVDAGNSVLVIEHNLDVIRSADWVIDLGPEGGAGGGRVVASGTPEQVARVSGSYTGRFLKGALGDTAAAPKAAKPKATKAAKPKATKKPKAAKPKAAKPKATKKPKAARG
jgi:excinuclease ABC subunit A